MRREITGALDFTVGECGGHIRQIDALYHVILPSNKLLN
jgi:hypothetical protein